MEGSRKQDTLELLLETEFAVPDWFTDEKIVRFFQTQPLLTWESGELNSLSGTLEVPVVDLFCPECDKIRPFRFHDRSGGMFVDSGQPPPPAGTPVSIVWGLERYEFRCTDCRGYEYHFWVEIDKERKAIRKLGQHPPWSVELDRRIEKFLGGDSEFMKKGLICESQGYGIGAFAYYRRVVENCIGNLLTKLRDMLEAEKASHETIDSLNAALAEQRMEDRIRIAVDLLPAELHIEGVNPLSSIYGSLSAGIHELSEEECMDRAEAIRTALSYLVEKLAEKETDRGKYHSALAKLQKYSRKRNT